MALERHCETFRINEPEVEALLEHYPFDGCTTWEKKTMSDICRAIRLEKPTKAQHMRIAEAIRRHNGGQKPHKSNSQNWHFVPAINVMGPKNAPICIVSDPSHFSKSLSEILDKWDD